MKPFHLSLAWALFLGTYIIFFILIDDNFSESWLGNKVTEDYLSHTSNFKPRATHTFIGLSLALMTNLTLILLTLSIIEKCKRFGKQTSATSIDKPHKTRIPNTPIQLTALWFLGFIPYTILVIVLFAFFPEMWLWELILNTYDFVGDPLWDYIYESFIVFLALFINIGLIYPAARFLAVKTNSSLTKENT